MPRRPWSEEEERNPPPGYREKRRALLKAAAALYAEHGTAAISLDRLSVQMGHAHNYHTRYFPTKERLVYALLDSHLGDLLAALDDAEEGASPRTRLEALAACYLSYALGDGNDAHRAFGQIQHWLTDERRLDVKVKQRWLVALFAEAIEAAAPGLAAAPQLLTPLTMSLFAMLNGALHWLRPEGGTKADTPRLGATEYVALAVGCIVAGAEALAGGPEQSGA